MARRTGLPKRERSIAERLVQEPALPPRGTYRLQFHQEFPLSAASEIVPYLSRLGISHIYASPVWTSTTGSTHGYDVVDYARIDEDLGGRQAFDDLTAVLDAHGMSLVLDMVPNHMGIGGGENAWWQDVLENGQASSYATFFDIDWLPLKFELQNQVLLPFLGDQFGNVLERGEFRLVFDGGAFSIDYFGTPFPIAPPTYPRILRPVLDQVRESYEPDELAFLELESIVASFERLPSNDERDGARLEERRREQTIAKRRLAASIESEPQMRAALERTLERLQGVVGDPASFDELEAILDAQSYRLAYWRVAAEEINYRRFFAIDELAAICQEVPEVFAASHALLLELLGSGQVSGVRIDHPDGLWDPDGYLHALQAAGFLSRLHALAAARRANGVDETTWRDWQPELQAVWSNRPTAAPLYVVVEKILELGEQLPETWPVAGTVGYEFASNLTGLFIRSSSRRSFDAAYRRFIGSLPNLSDLEYEQKKRVMEVALVSEVNVLARALDRLTEQNRRTRDYTLNSLRDALREIIACFPVYRTYLTGGETPPTQQERASIDQAVDDARHRNPELDPGVFEFIREMLQLRFPETATEDERIAACRFVMKFQQLTGPVMAKGVEDTVFYRYNRLLSVNEVGSNPARFGVSVEEFHRVARAQVERWPSGMLATSTHDTKRSEDVRTRISALSELPREWQAAVGRWSRLNRRHTTRLHEHPAPDRNDEYHFYQTLVGIWPMDEGQPDADFRDRLTGYMVKAAREAKVHTSWLNPEATYETALTSFVSAALDPKKSQAFLDDVRGFMPAVMRIGAFSSLSQQLLKLTAPGVPDIYQGTELWNLSLVDPDNRRPVDYAQRQHWLDELMGAQPSSAYVTELLQDLPSGRIKLFLTAMALAHRSAHAELYARADYEPLQTRGPLGNNVVAFRRSLGEEVIVVVVPRLVGEVLGDHWDAPIGEVWRGTEVLLDRRTASSRYTNVFTGDEIELVGTGDATTLPVDAALEHFPVALLAGLPAISVRAKRKKSR